ncbi:MAG: nucleoside deaminase [Candidatus Latescibacterota bacterium]|nr:MAG: nucleoside deaminase [Candidatus Latescibacterota bacterium]
MKDDCFWMQHALNEAEAALGEGEVPVGAVVVLDGEIIGRGRNRTEQKGSPFEHAELVALEEAVRKRDRWVLAESSLYVTVEPCVMCVGALLLARVPRVVFGSREPKTGACESVFGIPNEPGLDHRMVVIGGVEAEHSKELLQEFFRTKRNRNTSK